MTTGMMDVVIDGKKVSVPPETTIYDAAAKLDIQIPILCHREHMNPVAVCRVCVVEEGSWRLAPACYRQVKDVPCPKDGVRTIKTHHTSERVKSSVTVLTEMLAGDHLSKNISKDIEPNELDALSRQLGITQTRFPKKTYDRGHDDSSVVIAVDHNLCILCDRCVRGCNDIRDNQVLARRGKGFTAGIAFDLNTPMGDSTCVSCGECMVSCPTGALSFRRPVGADPWHKVKPRPGPVSAEDLAKHPLFDGVSKPFLRWNEGSVVRRNFKKGEIICQEGEYGSTAFLIEKGEVKIFIKSPLKHVKSLKKGSDSSWGPFGLIQKFATGLMGRSEDRRDDESTGDYIHIDAPVSLKYSDPVATLGENQIFGEMTCMNNYPRSATVRAETDCTVLEMQRNVLYILQRNKKSKALLDEIYRQRALENHLRSVGIFANLLQTESEFQRFFEFLRPRVELVRLNPGDTVFKQGDPADHFYLVRVGFVKVSQQHQGGERVLNYIGPGGYFGEIGLMSEIPEIERMVAKGQRTATCSALDHVDLVRIKGEDFREILKQFPAVRTKLAKIALEHLETNAAAMAKVEDIPLGEFLRQGLHEAKFLLVLDLEKCTRCDECTKACADSHDGVTRLIREGLRFDKFLVASSCRSCLDPYCMVGCPVGSIRRTKGMEIIIEDWCIGCGKCAENCPYGNINMHPFATDEKMEDPNHAGSMVAVIKQKATTCDQCRDVDGFPSCVYACPHDAAHRMAGAELLQLVESSNLSF